MLNLTMNKGDEILVITKLKRRSRRTVGGRDHHKGGDCYYNAVFIRCAVLALHWLGSRGRDSPG